MLDKIYRLKSISEERAMLAWLKMVHEKGSKANYILARKIANDLKKWYEYLKEETKS